MKNTFIYYCQIVCIIFFYQNHAQCSTSHEPVYLWIEAEDYESATDGVKVIRTDRVEEKYSPRFEKASAMLIKYSGRNDDVASKVSGGAYIIRPAGDKSDQLATYKCDLPYSDDYYIWIRIHNPPPCWSAFNLWFDDIEKKPEKFGQSSGLYGVWFWWAWGKEVNDGNPVSFYFEKGKHCLYLEPDRVHSGLRIDKILITTDKDYIPQGVNENFYTRNFTPPAWPRSGHGNSDKIRPTATGWASYPEGMWSVKKRPITENYSYYVDNCDNSKNMLKKALIRNLYCDSFEAKWEVEFASILDKKNDAILIFEYLNDDNYYSAKLQKNKFQISLFENGVEKILETASIKNEGKRSNYKFGLKRLKDRLIVTHNDQHFINLRMKYPLTGMVGIGSKSGGVYFDNIYIEPIDDPDAHFDMRKKKDAALTDWKVMRNGKKLNYCDIDCMQKGDVIIYDVPKWNESEVIFAIDNFNTSHAEIMFPFINEGNNISCRLEGGEISVTRSISGKKEHLKCFGVPLKSKSITIQNVQGQYSIFTHDTRQFETNEYEMTKGSIAIRIIDNDMIFPVSQIDVKKKHMIVDSFFAADDHSLSKHWKVLSGKWEIAQLFETNDYRDGQLISIGNGEIQFENELRRYLLQIQVRMEDNTKFSIVMSQGEGAYIEAYIEEGELNLRKIVKGNPRTITLVYCCIPQMRNGWHRIGFNIGKNNIAVEINGEECIRENVKLKEGHVGLRNYGENVIFDNMTLHIKEEANTDFDLIKHVDQDIIKIEESIMLDI